jgi:hypothetical protein
MRHVFTNLIEIYYPNQNLLIVTIKDTFKIDSTLYWCYDDRVTMAG